MAAMRGIGRVVAALPPGLTVNLGAVMGALAWRLAPLRRDVVLENLDIAFGDTISPGERRRIARETYKSFGMFVMESFYLAHCGRDWVESRIAEVEGWEHAQALADQGRGFIALSGHFGNWELMGAYAGRLGPIYPVSKPMHNPLAQEYVSQTRARHGLNILWSDNPHITSEISNALKGGGIVNFLCDQDMRQEGVFVPFFGRPASTVGAAAVFALRLGCAILPVFMVRLGPTRHRVVFQPPLRPEDFPGAKLTDRVQAMTAAHTRLLEDMIRLYPTQYFWFHRRWKTTPEAAARRLETLKRRRQKRRAAQIDKPQD